MLGLIFVTVPELIRQLRGTVIPAPAASRPIATPGCYGAKATSTRPSKPANSGTPTPMSHRDNELQLPYQNDRKERIAIVSKIERA